MRSQFSRPRRAIRATSQLKTDETYDLRGLNLVSPDQVIPGGETPFAINNRRYADNDSETSVAMRTREGSVLYATAPAGETADAEETGTVVDDIAVTGDLLVAIPFEAEADGALTKFEAYVKKAANTRGYLLIDIWNTTNDLPSRVIGRTSIAPNAVTTSYAYVPAYLMDAPEVEMGDIYWGVVRMQDLGVGTYYLGQVASGNIHTSTDGGATWIAQTYKARFKTHVSTAGFIKGFTKRYPETADNEILFALGEKLYAVPDSPATPAEVDTDLIDAASEKVRFVNIDERTFIIDGESALRMYDGATVDSSLGEPTALGPPVNGMILENRLLIVPKDDQTRIDFSALYDFETWPSVNFFYIGRPLSQDHITAMHEFREGATIFTKEMKYTLTGSTIQTFQPVPHRGSKGAISQEATAVGKEAIYFMADDRHIYSWNGNSDRDISAKIWPELKKILDLDKVRFHLYNNELRVYYNRNPDTTVNCMLLYDIAEDQWYKDTGRSVMGSLEAVHNNNELIEFSSKAGWIFEGEDGYSDLGKPIDFKYWTAYKAYGSGSARDRVKRFRPVVRPAQSPFYLSVGKDVDFLDRPSMKPWLVDSGGAQWGTFNWGDGTAYGGAALLDDRSPMSGRGKHTQYRFEHEGINQPVFLLGYIALIKSGRSR